MSSFLKIAAAVRTKAAKAWDRCGLPHLMQIYRQKGSIGARMSLYKDNEAILRNLADEGGDLSRSRPIEFSHYFADRYSANAFAKDAEREGYLTTMIYIERRDASWDLAAIKTMVPTCQNITETEQCLAALAKVYGGRSAGWGLRRD